MQFLFNLIENIQYEYIIKFCALPNLLYAHITAEDTETLTVYTKKKLFCEHNPWKQRVLAGVGGGTACCPILHCN